MLTPSFLTRIAILQEVKFEDFGAGSGVGSVGRASTWDMSLGRLSGRPEHELEVVGAGCEVHRNRFRDPTGLDVAEQDWSKVCIP